MANEKIRIEWDDIKSPQVDARLEEERIRRAGGGTQGYDPGVGNGGGPSPRVFGRISSPGVGSATSTAPGRSILFSSLFYCSMAGLVGALAGWALSEPLQRAFSETEGGYGLLIAALFFAVVGGAIGFGLGSIENFMSGLTARGFISGLIGLGLGLVGGLIAGLLGQAVFGMGAGAPGSIALVLDVSGSMNGAPIEELKRSATDFIGDGSEKGLTFSLISFSDKADILVPLSRDGASLQSAVRGLATQNLTNMPEGLQYGNDSLRTAEGQRTVVLFTDGLPYFADNQSQERFAQEEMARRNLTEASFSSMSPEEFEKTQTEIQQSIRTRMEAASREETVRTARNLRNTGTRIIALGTGEADRAFLEEVTADPTQVFYASAGNLSDAFQGAASLLFRSSASSNEITVNRVLLRSLSWGLVGLLLGLAQGIAMGSGKKIRNGLIGGLVGGLIGGFLFDPIGAIVHTDWLSRLVALCVVGGLIGLMTGLAENLLKDAWLVVTQGPLSGKQFVLYKNPTVLGSSPKADLYLFKDPDVAPQHAAIQITPQGHVLLDGGMPTGTRVNGVPITRHRLRPGDQIQLGRYVFAYSEKTKQPTAGSWTS
ncbi:VWA domain-containing protein [bacterium]|nr:VWA domain-containing protein [bacterium]